jgi:ketosteroid isomerase-like protein
MTKSGRVLDSQETNPLRERNRTLLIESRLLMAKLDHTRSCAADGGYADGRYSDLFNPEGRFETPFMPPGLKNCWQGKAEHDEDAEMRFKLLAEYRYTKPFEIHDCVDPNIFFMFSSGEGITMSGERYTNDYVHFAVFRDGRLDLLREYFDSVRVSRLAGGIDKDPLFQDR